MAIAFMTENSAYYRLVDISITIFSTEIILSSSINLEILMLK